MKRSGQSYVIIVLLAVLTGITHYAVYWNLEDRIEPTVADLWFSIRGPLKPPGDLVVIAMDEQSYSGLGIPMSAAWPRGLHAELLDKLAGYGAKRVIFDVLFLDEGINPTEDAQLATAISTVPTVLAAELTTQTVSLPGGSIQLEELQEAHDPFVAAAERSALVGLPEDHGVVRRFFVTRTDQTKNVPSMAEAAIGLESKEDELSTRDFINYYGPARTITTHSYVNVVQDERPLPAALFKDKTVFVGLSLRTEAGPAQKDEFNSPFYGSRIFGVEIHATAAGNLLEKTWIRRSGKFNEALLLTFLTVVVALFLFALNPLWGGGVLLGTMCIWAVCSYLLFLNHYFLPGLTLCGIILPLTYLGSTVFYYFVTRREQQRIASAFAHYLPPAMAQQMADDPKALSLGGEKVWATALFTDIAGFTAITETMPAERVSAMLNDYFTEVMDTIFTNDGALIKFIGDAVFAIWGAPVKIDNHAELAVRTAVAIRKEVNAFNRSERYPPLHTRIGVHTGPMVVGNLGCEKRFDFTAIGDSVNLAARTEGINKYFGTDVLITEATRKEIGSLVETVEMASVKVVGKKEAVPLYTIPESPLAPSLLTQWNDALEVFRNRSWQEAQTIFQEIGTKEPLFSKIADLYLEQIARHQSSAPDASWQGEIVFSSK